MDNKKEFQVSVADVIGEDIETGARLFTARTLINSSIKQEVANKEIKGGYGSRLQYEFDYDKKLTSEFEDCQFKETYLAMVNGQKIKTQLEDFWIWEEEHIVEDGKITVDETPVGKVVVENEDNYYEIQPMDKEVSVPFDNGIKVICSYQYNTSLETFDIDGSTFSKPIKITFISRIFNEDGLFKIMQIEIPRFKLDSKMDISLTHDGASTSKLTGKALDYNRKYAKVKIKRVNNTKVPIQSLVSTEQEIILNDGDSEKLSFIGIRGGMYGNTIINNTDVKFVLDNDVVAAIDNNGLITYKSDGTTIVTATLKDNPKVFDIIKIICS